MVATFNLSGFMGAVYFTDDDNDSAPYTPPL
jgi:hypothetical protein